MLQRGGESMDFARQPSTLDADPTGGHRTTKYVEGESHGNEMWMNTGRSGSEYVMQSSQNFKFWRFCKAPPSGIKSYD